MSFLLLNPAFEIIERNTGVIFEHWILIIIIVGSIIFMAKDFKLGMIIQLILCGVTFVWFYEAGFLWTPVLITFFVDVVILSFTIYAVNKSTDRGAII